LIALAETISKPLVHFLNNFSINDDLNFASIFSISTIKSPIASSVPAKTEVSILCFLLKLINVLYSK
jgi:hypothetical protein